MREKYYVGHCLGCGNRTSATVHSGDKTTDSEHIWEMVESGHAVRLIETQKAVGVEACWCDRGIS